MMSSTKDRLEFWKEQQMLLSSPDSLPSILSALFQTIPHYSDHVSRDVVVDTWKLLLKEHPAALQKVVPVLAKQFAIYKKSSTNNLMVLLEWTNYFVSFSLTNAGSELNDFVFKDLISMQAELVDLCSACNRERMAKSALRQTRAAFAACITANGALTKLLNVCLPGTPTSTALLGCLASACAENAPQTFEQLDLSAYSQFYGANVLGAKVLPCKNATKQFCTGYFGNLSRDQKSKVAADIFDATKKSILRSPESVLEYAIPLLLESLDKDDESAKKLVDGISASLVTCLKSSNQLTRDGAVTCIGVACAISHETLYSELAKTVSKVTVLEQKVAYGNAIAGCHVTDPSLSAALAPVVTKEKNEIALTALSRAFLVHFSPDQAKTLSSGLSDSNAGVVKTWVLQLVNFPQHAEHVTGELEKILASSTIVKGAISGLGAVYLLTKAGKAVKSDKALELALSPRVYTKLSAGEFVTGFKALESLFKEVNPDNAPDFGKTIFFYAYGDSEVKVDVDCSRLVGPALRSNYSDGLAGAVISGISDTHVSERKYSKLLYSLFSAENNCDKALVDGLEVLCGVGLWIESVLGASRDPRKLLLDNEKHVKSILSSATSSNLYPTIATVCFIAPDVFAGEVAEQFTVSNLSCVTTEAVTIFNTPADELAFDIKRTERVAHKNSKEYQDKLWEENLKKELQKKKGVVEKPKYTKEEQIKVDEQMKKEAEIRTEVTAVADHVTRLMGIISALSKEAMTVDNGKETWFGPAMTLMLELLRHPNVDVLCSSHVTKTLTDMSWITNDKLGSIRPFLAVCLLRMYGNHVSEDLQKESRDSLITRVLYKIHSVAMSSPLDAISLIFVLPIVLFVLKNQSRDKDVAEEQTHLAIEIVTCHTSAFADVITPRSEIMSALIQLMKSTPTKAKLARECLYSVVEHVALTITKPEEHVLLSNLFTGDTGVRHAILEAVDAHLTLDDSSPELYVTCFDVDDVNRELAEQIYSENKLCKPSSSVLLPFLAAESSSLRLSSARAYAATAEADSYNQLMAYIIEASVPIPPTLDQYGKPKKGESARDQWEARCGAGLAVHEMAPGMSPEHVISFIEFLVETGYSDVNSDVRQEFNDAGLALVDQHGLKNVEELMKIIQNRLNKASNGSESDDHVISSCVVLYGALARHLESSDSRLPVIYDRMLVALDTPSESVQFRVSECLSGLVSKMDKKARDGYLDQLTEKLLSDSSLAIRRGAAYGIAGLVRGGGIASIGETDLMRTLTDAMENKKSSAARQSAQFVVETLSMALQRHFEPYALQLMPLVLAALGDPVFEVREATNDASRQVMKHTTAYGVTKLIPMAIENLNLTAWRSKRGAVELLGNMAYLSPHELSTNLSLIVPEIVAVLNDTHKEVRAAANSSLNRFGHVISNPEIQALVPKLIGAIAEPEKTEVALDGLLKTQFVHYIDAPSLALISHVLQRGLGDRSAAVKKKACQIVGNMAILTSAQDIAPYLPELTVSLETAMVDPVPGTRATAARALGSLVEKLGEPAFPDLVPRLLSTLRDESRAGDHLGAAQGLSEVVCGLGLRKLEEILPQVIKSCASPKNHIRAAFMPLMIFLPATFGNSLTPYLSQIIPVILSGLADDVDSVRDASLKAGRLLVSNFSSKSVDLLLPELLVGMSDSNHRIRLASVELMGDLLFQLTGLTKNELDESDDVNAGQALLSLLGQQTRDTVLANLFVCRADTSGQVRLASIEIWKALVANTPRTVKEILPELTNQVVTRLASRDHEQREIAASTLGELVRRVSDSLQQLLPTLQTNLDNSDSDQKQGICIALKELIVSSSRDQLDAHKTTVVHILHETLTDSSRDVRSAAASAFDAYNEIMGNSAVDDILPKLLLLLKERPEAALAALKDIMQSRANSIFPVVLPKLLSQPISVFNAEALASLAPVAGQTLLRRLPQVVGNLVSAIISARDQKDDERASALFDSLVSIFLSVSDEGIHSLMQQLKSMAKDEDSAVRTLLFETLTPFFKDTQLDLSAYYIDWAELCIYGLDDESVSSAAKSALETLVKNLSKEELETLSKPAYSALANTSIPLAGINVPKGPACILPIFVQGLMYGTSDQREASANGMGCIVERVDASLLKLHVTQITGPLIRTIGERFPASVKVAIVTTLNLLLKNCSAFLKPFLPQLQRTFAKCLSDTGSERLRNEAAEALGTLITLQSRVDPLVSELVTGVKNSTDEGVTNAMFKALQGVVSKAGGQMSQQSRDLVFNLADEVTGLDKHVLAKMLGGLAKVGDASVVYEVSQKVNNSEFGAYVLNELLVAQAGDERVSTRDLPDDSPDYVTSTLELMKSETPAVSDAATLACGKLLLAFGGLPFEITKILLTQLAQNITAPASSSSDTRRLALVVLRTVARQQHALTKPHVTLLATSTFACVREMVIPIKLAAEKAWLALFDLVTGSTEFDKWFGEVQSELPNNGRSIGDYTKRVAMRLAQAERERLEEGGDDMESDKREDEAEIWE
ncbi:armadillo-type protein [Yarrowia lipolytica]|nr:armadillo-type protein [Yarrowia lipolytica]RDW37547.1 armadillo-type protein [Yarrowia lipolytica]RDW43531.1 armadillo-type protein [Yarrowia lipolytica]RDW50641.1 armadillo-type protein [Yarrowia lipolytica]